MTWLDSLSDSTVAIGAVVAIGLCILIRIRGDE